MFGKLQPGFLDGFRQPFKDLFLGACSENWDILSCLGDRGHSFASLPDYLLCFYLISIVL